MARVKDVFLPTMAHVCMEWYTTWSCSPSTTQELKFLKLTFLIFWPLTTITQATFSPYLGIGSWGGALNGVVYNLLTQFFTRYSSRIEVSETYFFDIVAAQNDHPSYVKHVFGSINVFFTLSGYLVWGGSPNGLVHNWYTTVHNGLMQFFILGSSKIGTFQNSLF